MYYLLFLAQVLLTIFEAFGSEFNILTTLPFCHLLKSRRFSIIIFYNNILSGFLFSNFIWKLFCIFNRDILCLDFLVCAFVGLGDSNTVGSDVLSGVASGVGSGVGI